MADIVILGAGLTGLSTAYHLEKNGFSNFICYEKTNRPGGLLKSVEIDGFTFDHTGHLLHINDDYFKSFLDTIANLNQNFSYIQRKSAIYSHNVMSHYPFQMNLYGLPASVITECIKGFVEREASRKNTSSFHEWVLKYFGQGFSKYFFTPYNNKLLAYDIKEITPSWTGRFVPQTTLESVIEGALINRHEGNIGYNSYFYYPKKGGIEFLIKQINKQLKMPIYTNRCAQAIDIKKKIVYFSDGHKEPYTYLISTIPLNHLLSSLIEPTSSFLSTASKYLECNSVINMNLGLKKETKLDKHWIYFPEKKFTFYRMGLWHNICQQLSPKGKTSIYAETSYLPSRTNSKEIEQLVDKTRKQILTFMDQSEQDIVVEKTLHLKHAYVIYNQWREQNLHLLLNQLEKNQIYSIGRFGAWKYSSMQEAILEGKEMAHIMATAFDHYLPTTQKHINNKKAPCNN